MRAIALVALLTLSLATEGQEPPTLDIHWDAVAQVCRTTPTLQVVVNPMLARSSPVHKAIFDALRDLRADYVRFVPWLPYPRLAVAELQPGQWDTRLIDPMVEDFFRATEGHSTVLNFSTIPAWLFKTDQPVTYPKDPQQVTWTYTQGKELRPGALDELGKYYARLVGWYTRDRYRFRIPYWEVLNEPDIEHQTSPQDYTARYDAIVTAIHAVSPDTRFVGLGLAYPSAHPEFFEYFLDRRNHRPGIPLDMISYHFYATPTADEGPEHWQYTFFNQADRFLATVRYIEQIRKRLSPETRTTLNEIGSILPGDPQGPPNGIPDVYWQASGALFAYIYLETTKLGIDIVGESQLVGYPTQFPSVTMIDCGTGRPNARYWVLKLIHDRVVPGDRLVETKSGSGDVDAQGVLTAKGRALLLINKRNAKRSVRLPEDFQEGTLSIVGADGIRTVPLSAPTIELPAFAVAVVNWQRPR